MVRSRNLAAWCLVGAGAFVGCRVGYDEIIVIDQNAGGDGGAIASGGSSGSSGGAGGTDSSAGEAGDDATGATSVSGGTGGSSASGGTIGGEGGESGLGGSSAAGDSAGGTNGSSGGAAGTSGGTTSGASGGAGEGGASDAGAGGVSGTSGASGTGGALGSGGFAGASSLGDCQTKTFGGHDYVFCNVNLAWGVARDNCASIGMFLVRVDDSAESQWVYDNVYDTPPRQGVWIGANDIAQEGEWRWPDGTLFWLGDSSGSAQNGAFVAWYPMQPSGQEPRDCGAMDGNTLGWYALDCTIPQPYACETP
jgi:hypothetical protein